MMTEVPIAFKIVVAVGAAMSVLFGGMTALDSRYEQRTVHQPEHEIIQAGMDDMSYAVLKKEIREIRAALEVANSAEYIRALREDLQNAIDRLCRIAPDDRECK